MWALSYFLFREVAMKSISVKLPDNLKEIELHPLADLHLGDAHSDWELIQGELKHIMETPNAYCILGGDLMDSAIKSSIGDIYTANIQPMEQLRQCVEIFEPLAKAGKILAVVGGNHEFRHYKTNGVDMTSLMCSQLNIADKYSSETAVIFLRFGHDVKHNRPQCYSIYLTHGSGGGRREGGKINRLADLATIIDTDVYVCGHTHLPAVFRQSFFRADRQNNSVFRCEKLFVNTAAALNYGGYGEVQGYKPASKINPVILLSGTKHEMAAII